MTAIKLVLIVAVLAIFVWGFRNRQRTAMRASLRVLALCVACFAILSIADPAITTRLAKLMGVGRGADLLLYLSVFTFGVATLGLYFRSRNLEQKVDALTRDLAINAALAADGPPDVGTKPNVSAGA